MEKKHWYDEEVHDLVNYSDSKFETRIPCADEVLKLNYFIWQMMLMYSKKDKATLIIPKDQPVLFRVFHIGQSKPFEIEVPEDAVWQVVHQTKRMLDDKCDYLAELCGYKRKED